MHPSRQLSRLALFVGLLLAIASLTGQRNAWSLATPSYAQGTPAAAISFTNPGALTVTVDAGDDFATTVLGDAWDMNTDHDISYEIGFNNISTSNGLWSGTYSGVDQASGTPATGYVFPLFQGFSSPLAGQFSQELAFNKFGGQDRFAINAAKYTRLSYRMSVSPRTINSPLAVYWTTAKPVTWPNTTNYFANTDACQGSNTFFPWNGWHLYNFDLTQANGAPAARAGAWQGLVRGLRIDPSTAGATGTQVKIDWIRLSDPTSAPTIAIPWNTTGVGTSDRVDLYVADNAAGTDAAPIAYGLAASAGKYDLPTSILPPGQHYFQLRLQDGSQQNGCSITKSVSAWIGPLTIATKPIITFAKPSKTSGADYATTELGQPWEMTSSADIVTPGLPYPQYLTNVSFSDGIFSAKGVIIPPQTETDAQFWLRVDPNRPINSTRYHYFTVRLKVDLPAGKDLNWAIAHGWGGRVIWWNTGIQTDGSETKYGTYYEGWRTYTIDLAQATPPLPLSNLAQADNILTPREQSTFPAQLGWTQLGTVKNLRFDPLETMQPAVGTGADVFAVDWVKLTATDEVQRGLPFTIETGVNVQPTTLKTLNFYYTTDINQPTQHLAVQTAKRATTVQQLGAYKVYLPLVVGATPSTSTTPVVGNPVAFTWDTATVAPGTYYICGAADTGVSVATYCSDAPVVVLP